MDGFTQFDGNLLIGIQQALNAEWLTPVMKAITMFGEGGIFWIAVCLLLMIFKRTRRLGILCSLSLAFTFLCCNLVLKPLIDRTRPWITFSAVNAMLPPVSVSPSSSAERPLPGRARKPSTSRISSPSSSLCCRMALASGCSLFCSRGMHYPSDVICGLLTGMICATIIHNVVKKAEAKRGIIGE